MLFLPLLLILGGSAQAAPVTNPVTGANDYSCRSAVHPNPVVLLHGLGGANSTDLYLLQTYLQEQGFCTYSLTYGAYPEFPLVGGLKPIEDSAQEIASFIQQVQSKTGAKKIDLVGHSEGGFQSIYVPKFTSARHSVQRVFAIVPPTHGTTFSGLSQLTNLDPALVTNILDTVGCQACPEIMPNGTAVEALNTGPISQPGIEYTVLTTKYDVLVTPPEQACFIREPGARNILLQDYCPDDPVGHLGTSNDGNVWAFVENTLEGSTAGPAICIVGTPGR